MKFRLLLLLVFVGLIRGSAFGQYVTPTTVIDYGGSRFPGGIATSDLDKDGDMDVISFGGDNYYEPIYMFLNNGNGKTFSRTLLPNSTRIGTPGLVMTSDLDKNGYEDIIVMTGNDTNNSTNKVVIWYNAGNGNFSSPVIVAQNLKKISHNQRFHLFDIDNDGDLDIFLPHMYENGRSIWLKNNGRNGSWLMSDPLNITTSHLAIADFDNDGIPEIAGNSGSGGTLYTGANFARELNLDPATNLESVALYAADIDKDGDQDIVGMQGLEKGFAWLENTGNLKFTFRQIENTGGSFQAYILEDFNQDGLPDIVAACWSGCSLAYFENTGNGTFKRVVNSVRGNGSGINKSTSMVTADFDGDGKKDLLVSDWWTHSVYWSKSNFEQLKVVSADFRINYAPCKSYTPEFTDLSIGTNIITWQWSFGDGESSTAKNPSHTYAKPGTYQVTLVVTSQTGEKSTKTKEIKIIASPVITQSAFDLFYCAGSTPTVSLPTTTDGTDYIWYATRENTQSFYTGTSYTDYFSSGNLTFYVEKKSPEGCTSNRVPVYIKKMAALSLPRIDDAVSYAGSALLKMEVTNPEDQDLEYFWYDPSINAGQTAVHKGRIYQRHFTQTQTFYVQTVHKSGCVSAGKTRVTAYIFQKSLTIPQFTWAISGQSKAASSSSAITSNQDGDILALGSFSGIDQFTFGNITLDPGPIPTNTWNTWWYKNNHYLLRLPANNAPVTGSRAISQMYPNGTGSPYVDVRKMYTDKKNNIYYVGEKDGAATFGNTQVNGSGHYIIKFNNNHDILWVKTLPFKDNQGFGYASYSTQVDQEGNVICEVTLRNSLIIDGQHLGIPAITGRPATFSRYVLKYSNQGNLEWVKEIAILDENALSNVVLDEAGNLYQVGSFKGSTYFKSKQLASTSKEIPVGILIKYSAQGEIVWAKIIASGDHGANATKVALADKQLYVFGNATIKNNKGVSFSGKLLDNANAYLSKYNLNGELQWIKGLETKGDNTITLVDLLFDRNNEPLLIGSTTHALYLDGLKLANSKEANAGFTFLAKYSQEGNLNWAKNLNNHPYSLMVQGAYDVNNNLYIQGTYQGSFELDGISLSNSLQNFNNSNMFIGRMGYVLEPSFQSTGTCSQLPVAFTDLTANTPNETVVTREWSFGDGAKSSGVNTTHTYSKAGVYEVILNIQGSLGSKMSAKKQITILESPKASITVSHDTLKAAGGDTFRWFLNDSLISTTNNVHIAKESGRYKVEVTKNGCSILSEEKNIIKTITDLNIFPNPTSGVITFNSTTELIKQIKLYDGAGNLIKEIAFPDSRHEVKINLQGLAPNVYVAYCHTETGKVLVYKIIKV